MKFLNFKNKINKSKGFTLIETMVAIVILTTALNALIGLSASSIFLARYANNEITANYLIQEAIDSIRNDRDSLVLHNLNISSADWNTFVGKYNVCFNTVSADGCYLEPTVSVPLITTKCTGNTAGFGTLNCPALYYDDTGIRSNDYYTYLTTNFSGAANVKTNFKRQVIMYVNSSNPDEVDIKVTVEWINGSMVKSKTVWASLLNWQKI